MPSERVAIVGAGLMGHGLAQVFAHAGHEVAITDVHPEALTSVRERITANLSELGHDSTAGDRVTPYAQLRDAVTGADVVIEAVSENLELKRDLFAEIERHCPADAMLATNTSVIPVSAIGQRLARPDRMVGTHWWNPPYLIPLVEVVQAERSGPETVSRMIVLLTSVGKQPVHVRRDVPGFVGNRLQHALWREAIALVADGICDAETVDTVVKGSFGLRLPVLGPLENADLIGLDLTAAIHHQVLPHIDRTAGVSPYLQRLVSGGDLGMKAGKGFHHWEPGARERISARLTAHLKAATASDQGTNKR